jgi:AraC-like DNA-binding protein
MSEQIRDNLVPHVGYVVYRKCTPSWHIVREVYPAWNLTYVIKGTARYTVNGRSYNLSEGDLLCLAPGMTREAVTFPDNLMRCYSVDFQLTDTEGKSAALPFLTVSRIGIRGELSSLFERLFRTWLEKQTGYVIKTRGLFLLLLYQLYEILVYNTDSADIDYRIRKAKSYMTAHFNKRLTVKKMAKMFNLNSHYFGNLFRRETGITMNRYLMKIRCENARTMLASGKYRVEDMPEICGFTDSAHLYKCFKDILGFPPSRCLPKGKHIAPDTL